MNGFPWLTCLNAVPLVGAIVLLCVGSLREVVVRRLALLFSFASLLMVLDVWRIFQTSYGGMQLEERHSWIAVLGVDYHVGIDGLGTLMLLLTAIVVPIAILASSEVKQRVGLYFALVLLLQACLFGTFTALNFFPWFSWWELSLIPSFFLIKLWGGPHSTRAATQALIYTMVGSITMLLGFVAMFLATKTLDLIDLARIARSGQLMPAMVAGLAWRMTPEHTALLLFAGVFLGFAVKVPLVPFHTWLPDAYAEAPTGTTILLTGAMSKMGLYGMLRILVPLFGAEMQRWITPLLWVAVATVVLGAYSALAQTELKRIFAYSSVNHLGYCWLGILAAIKLMGGDASWMGERYAAMDGVLLQMFNHGLTAAALFWFLARLEMRSGGLLGWNDFGGLRRIAPIFTGLMGITLFSSLGLPGLNGFVGEFLIFKGSFALVPWATSLCALGLLVTALFILGVLQKVFSGPINPRWDHLPDLTLGERFAIAPAIALMFAVGLYPQCVLQIVNSTAIEIVQHLRL